MPARHRGMLKAAIQFMGQSPSRLSHFFVFSCASELSLIYSRSVSTRQVRMLKHIIRFFSLHLAEGGYNNGEGETPRGSRAGQTC